MKNITVEIEYEQIKIRTMFFERNNSVNEVIFDGVHYEVSNSANIDHFNCKQHLYSLWNSFNEDAISPDLLRVDTY